MKSPPKVFAFPLSTFVFFVYSVYSAIFTALRCGTHASRCRHVTKIWRSLLSCSSRPPVSTLAHLGILDRGNLADAALPAMTLFRVTAWMLVRLFCVLPIAVATFVDNIDPRIRYTGSGWTTDDNPKNNGGSANRTNVKGDSASFNFTGKSILRHLYSLNHLPAFELTRSLQATLSRFTVLHKRVVQLSRLLWMAHPRCVLATKMRPVKSNIKPHCARSPISCQHSTLLSLLMLDLTASG